MVCAQKLRIKAANKRPLLLRTNPNSDFEARKSVEYSTVLWELVCSEWLPLLVSFRQEELNPRGKGMRQLVFGLWRELRGKIDTQTDVIAKNTFWGAGCHETSTSINISVLYLPLSPSVDEDSVNFCGLPVNTLNMVLDSSIHAACPAHCNLRDFIALTVPCDEFLVFPALTGNAQPSSKIS
uniref:Uncharacterized protein n=1 Tax=Timema cristinae TaxID=61476 RepID=A0A7R9D798_TIMCR|nr:unnamed protein product [Timema cristinae]